MGHGKYIKLAGTGIAVAVLAGCQPQKMDHTNFVVIFMDDMGYGDISATGATGYSTPNLDRLCTEGMRLTNFYAAQAVSSASRAGLMTGCYPNRVGFAGALFPDSPIGLNPDETTMAEMLHGAGYYCGMVGKWHLGSRPEFYPTRHGFDEYFGLLYSNDMWPYHPQNADLNFSDLPLYENEAVVNPALTPRDQEQLTTKYTERAVKFIKQNSERPFFLYLAHQMPHVPLFVSDKFKDKSIQGLYGDIMMEIDWSVGEILKALREAGIDESTMVVFTSDNGPWINYGNHAGSTGGLREGKSNSYEGGQRVPCIVRWPGRVPAGVVCDGLGSTIDLLPTFAAISEAPLPSAKIDGVDISPLLEGVTVVSPRNHFLYYYRDNNLEAVRNDKFKLVFPHPGRTYEGFLPGNDGLLGETDENRDFPMALYDLRRDPGERYDVSAQNPKVVAQLTRLAQQAREELGDDLTADPGSGRREIGRVY